MSGDETVQEAIELQQQLIKLAKRGGFPLCKWSSNHKALLSSIPPELRESDLEHSLDKDHLVKTPGLFWNAGTDSFTFKVNLPVMNPSVQISKRTILSEMSKTFDPLGWLSPVTIRGKIMFQKLWKLKIGWDDPLPEFIHQEWMTYRDHLSCLEKLSIGRYIKPQGTKVIDLHGFSDASEQAYSALVYMRAEGTTGKPTVSLVTSKTRVAPSKTISIPRLELCGALLLSKLMKNVQESLKCNIQHIYSWTDSTIVLNWLADEPSRWKTFVANRVTEIQEGINMTWGHVKGSENPADCASRGIDPLELQDHPLWWQGPAWLKGNIPTTHLKDLEVDMSEVEKERKPLLVAIGRMSVDTSLLHKFEFLITLKRVTTWCKRFIRNCIASVHKKKGVQSTYSRQHGPLTPGELEDALMLWIRVAQRSEFREEIQCIKSGIDLPSKSRLQLLNPFLDPVSKVIRVGGRPGHATVDHGRKFPILLPRHHKLTELIISEVHRKTFHGGAQLVTNVIQSKYWIIKAKDFIRHQLRRCVTCTKNRAETMKQYMGDLPPARVTPARPFLNCSVDYLCWSFYCPGHPRPDTRAVHLEVVSSLSTDAFLATLKRFIGRRGKCQNIYSDCGTNFVGAARELKEVLALINSDEHNTRVANHLSSGGTRWHFNPPGAPHFGGLWEAGVKSVKYHLHRVKGSTRLTFEELTTIMVQIEACLNSRPLTPCSTDPDDLMALTPAHFLIGDSLQAIPEPDLRKENVNRLTRWQMTQQITQHFWKHWSQEYLTRLQQRPKLLRHRENIHLNDMVLIKEDNLPQLRWKLGRVIKTSWNRRAHSSRHSENRRWNNATTHCQALSTPYQQFV